MKLNALIYVHLAKSFIKFVYLCKHYHNQDIEYFHHLKKFPCTTSQTIPSPTSSLMQPATSVTS